ncbi:MAG TPA: hypothetical protein DEB39_00485 [Planctomycetaceae bacterium]|nr:hypothetical protein [Planctomycetaceae bacterium]
MKRAGRIDRKRPEIVPANNRLSLERNVQQDVYKCPMARECDKRPSPNNQSHHVSGVISTSTPTGFGESVIRCDPDSFGQVCQGG